jgi:hypothetical protein
MITTPKDSLVGLEVSENSPSNCQFGGLAPRQPFRRLATILRLIKDHSALLSRVLKPYIF